MLLTPETEQRLCTSLKALVEEFGPEPIFVKLPKCWQDMCEQTSLGKVKLGFLTENTIELSVKSTTINIVVEVGGN